MQGSTRKRGITRNGVAPSSSVWETRIKLDEMKGGVKVFNAGERSEDDGIGDQQGLRVYRRLRRNQSDGVAVDRRKRKNCRAPEPGMAGERSPVPLRKSRSELCGSPRSCNENCLNSGNEKNVIDVLPSVDQTGEKGVSVDVKDCCEDGGGGGKEVEVEVEERVEIEMEEKVEIEMEEGMQSFDDKEMDLPLEKPRIVEEEDKIDQTLEITMPPDVEKKPNSVMDRRPAMHPDLVKPPSCVVVEEEVIFGGTASVSQHRMQGLVDLIMWRDISKSAFIFGFGTFFLLSSTYTRDLNFSLISTISYLGLVYLGIIFLYKSILHRGEEFDERDERYIVGEEEVIWLVRLILPYINELLLMIRALFSGDPATTMKLAVLLFVMARCGSSITIWTLTKLGFIGVFTIPKVFSSYSVQLARYGKFWLERFRDGWESCTHKKAVAAAIFTLIWNLSSTAARVWAVFMLIVTVRFYQQCMVAEEQNGEEDKDTTEETRERQEESRTRDGYKLGSRLVRHRRASGPTLIEVGSDKKAKKGL